MCKSQTYDSEHQNWSARNPVDYPPSVIRYLDIQSKPIKQQPTFILFMVCWDFAVFHWYKTRNGVGWQIAIKVRIGFKHQITATLGFHWLYDWSDQMMQSSQGVPDDPLDDTVMVIHCADTLYSAVKSMMTVIWADGTDDQPNAVHQIIQIAKCQLRRRWLETKLANRIPQVQIPQDSAHLIQHECTE